MGPDTRKKVVAWLGWSSFVVALCVAVITIVVTAVDSHRIHTQGTNVVGRVVSTEFVPGGYVGGDQTCRVSYVAQGLTRFGSYEPDDGKPCWVGTEVDVRYDPKAPDDFIISGGTAGHPGIVVAGFCLLYAAWFLWMSYRGRRRRRDRNAKDVGRSPVGP